MNIKPDLLEFLTNAGHEKLIDIQLESIDCFETHNNVILYSKTGSGKTLAYLLSLLSKKKSNVDGIQAIILAPARELCIQIEEVFKSLKSGEKVTLCYGGHSIKTEKNSLMTVPSVIIGTPGRISDHIDRGNINLEFCSFLVIDEFDKCLEFGFDDEMSFICDQIKGNHNKMLVSATKIGEIPDYLGTDKYHVIDKIKTDSQIKIKEYVVDYDGDVIDTLGQLIASLNNERTIVFCNYREVTEDVSERLKKYDITSTYYHGGLMQQERERALMKFRNGSSTVLICTDLGSRGLDIPDVNHIIHYQYPGSREAFIHRTGRTARMTANGNSYLLKGPSVQIPDYLDLPDSKLILKQQSKTATIPEWTTLYFSAGKKDKVNKIDIVGFLMKKGNLAKDEIGLITVKDHACYAAVKRGKVKAVLNRVQNEKVKGRRLKIELSK